MSYTVRTLFLQNYFTPARELAAYRRGSNQKINMEAVTSAMKRTEHADRTLEAELNAFAERGYEIVSIIPHPIDADNPYDLLMTIILSQTET